MANNLGITEGEYSKEINFKVKRLNDGPKVARIHSDKGKLIATFEGAERKEGVLNSKLFMNAGTTANKCGKLPSELLKERDALLDKLKDMTKYIRRELTLIHEAPEKEIKFILDGSEELIQSVEE